MDRLRVAVGVVIDPAGQVLVAHRDAARHQGGRLELPGGKIEHGESPITALARELDEELGIRPTGTELLIRVCHDYDDLRVELHAFRVSAWDGRPHGREGQAIEWLPREALAATSFPAANRPILAALQWPPLCLVTPDIEMRESGLERVCEAVRRAVAHGVEVVQLRAPSWSAEDLLVGAGQLVEEVGPRVRVLVNASVDMAVALPGGVGLHLTAARAAVCPQRPIDADRWLSVSVHDRAELVHAERIGADLAFVAPVRSTQTHPGAPSLGWPGLEALAAATSMPLFGLGGLEPGDLAQARLAGAIGVAGIRGFQGRFAPD